MGWIAFACVGGLLCLLALRNFLEAEENYRRAQQIQRWSRTALNACADLHAEPELERMIRSFRERGSFAFVTLTEAQEFADVLERAARATVLMSEGSAEHG